ncbi:MAG TPA: Bax inhibitor-1 family protein, partial [Gemmataceae bacterium]|nr:Bax inhibitor-1 family protein [Gemmataceae bacterium]
MSYASGYSPHYDVAANAPATERATFIRKTYLHLAGAILAFVVLEAALLKWVAMSQNADQLMHWISSPGAFFVLMLVFMGGGYLGNHWARTSASPAMQYLGLGLYVVVEAIIFLPLMIIAVFYTGDPTLIPKAGIMTLSLFAGLTAAAFITRKDFSFLGPIIAIASFAALGLIVAAMLFPSAINLGLWFSFAIVALSAASILYTTS